MSNVASKKQNMVKTPRGKKKPTLVEVLTKVDELNKLLLDKESEITINEQHILELKSQLEFLEKSLKKEKNKYEEIYSDAIEAQKVRANHWRKYEVESLKNELIVSELIQLAQTINHQERTLSFALGNIIIGFIKGDVSLDRSISLIADSYLKYLKKVNPSSIDSNLTTIENILNSLKESNKLKKITKMPLLKKTLKKLNIHLIGHESISPNANKNNLEKIVLNGAKEFRDLIEKKAIDHYESHNKYSVKEKLKKTETIKKITTASKLKVAVIFDEFTYECFKYEFDCYILEPNNWKEIFKKNQPEIFFCESAWSGVDSKKRPWKGQIYSSINFTKENRTVLLDILEYCNKNNIPTVFWNKEDPTHYDDEVHSFAKTANLFDYIFTVSEECVEKYKKDFNRDNVFVLPFATQPKIFNPLTDQERKVNTVTFAGSWYENHNERSKSMRDILDRILDAKKDLVIYDRFYGTDDINHIFPDAYKKYTYPAVPFTEIDKVYKEGDISLTINTVRDSKTMVARRAFELMSCNTLVLSNSSLGMESLFKGLYIDVEENPHTLLELDENENEIIRNRALVEVLEKHTYKIRWKNILNKISYKYIEEENTLTYCIIVDDKLNVDDVVYFFNKYKINNSKLLLIIDDSIDDSDILNYFCNYSSFNLNVVSMSYLKNYIKNKFIINTTHFMLLSINDEEIWKKSNKVLMHYEYLDNDIISLINSNHLKFIKNGVIKNIIAPVGKFYSILENYNKEYGGKMYCLNVENI